MRSQIQQLGVSLIEVMITVVIMASSLLAMTTLQTRSLQFNQSALMRSQANIYAYDIIDRIRINRGSASENIAKYNADYDADPSGNTLAVQDVAAWRANLVKALPTAKGAINCNASTRVCKVTIKWTEEYIFGTADDNNKEATTELVYTTSI